MRSGPWRGAPSCLIQQVASGTAKGRVCELPRAPATLRHSACPGPRHPLIPRSRETRREAEPARGPCPPSPLPTVRGETRGPAAPAPQGRISSRVSLGESTLPPAGSPPWVMELGLPLVPISMGTTPGSQGPLLTAPYLASTAQMFVRGSQGPLKPRAQDNAATRGPGHPGDLPASGQQPGARSTRTLRLHLPRDCGTRALSSRPSGSISGAFRDVGPPTRARLEGGRGTPVPPAR